MATGTTSIWGRPYPTSSDVPNVHSDIQALANSLETTPLYPTTAVTSRTGIAGESVLVSPSQTLTLPAAPTKGDIIQIIAGAVTGATAVTVAASGSKVINGPGLTSGASFPLGMPQSRATVQYDGTAWRITQGAPDTGWLSLTLSSGYTASAGEFVPAGRLVGDNPVELRGGFTNATTNTPQGTVIATMPAALGVVAVSGVRLSIAVYSSSNIAANIMVASTSMYYEGINSIPSTAVISLDGVSYFVA
jgi:hypothetical protein